MTNVGVVGRSHMAVVWSAVLAEKGFKTTYLKSARFECYEPDLKALIEKGIKSNMLEYKVSYSSLSECDVVFVAWDTEITEDNKIKLDLTKRVINAVIPNLSSTCILVIMCQVPPGFMRSIDFPKDRLFHQVDTLVFGDSITKAKDPEYVVIGTSDYLVPDKYLRLISTNNIKLISYEEAEIYKLAMNAYLAAQIAVTNTMAELCKHYEAEWYEVSRALPYDKRIGTYTKPGLGIGGGHMERDLHTIELLSNKHGFHSDIIGGALASSHHMRYWAVRQLRRLGYNLIECKIAVWGLSYKTGTDSIKDSPAIFTINEFPNCTFKAHDPQASVTLPNLTMVNDPKDTIEEDTDALLIMTPYEEYKDLIIFEKCRGVIIDPYKVLNNVPEHCLYKSLG